MKIYANCNKIRNYDGRVTVYDYVVEPTFIDGDDLVCRYIGKDEKMYYMTIPNAMILARGTLEPKVYKSKFNGPHKEYKCYSFKWVPDDRSRN